MKKYGWEIAIGVVFVLGIAAIVAGQAGWDPRNLLRKASPVYPPGHAPPPTMGGLTPAQRSQVEYSPG